MFFQKTIIDVCVTNLDRAIKFYRDILGLSLIKAEMDWAALDSNGAEIHLYNNGGAKSGLEFRVADIKKEIDDLKKKGVEFFNNSDEPNLREIKNDVMIFSWGRIAYFKDSEGNRLALVEDES